MEKKLLPYLVVISALSVSLSAAFYSVTGIGGMFSGSSTNVMIMMTSLEISKLVLASLLYQYWSKLNSLIKIYYIFSIFVLMVITSAGIYGYLSSAYSETAYKVENVDKQVSVLVIKREMFETQLNDIRLEKQRITDNITDLTKGLSNNNQSYKDKSGNILTYSSSSNRKAFEGQLNSSQKRRDELSLKETILNDSITKIDLKKLDLETNSDLAGEIGSLKYIAKITGKSIDVVVNWFIIALMLVFDPLAVSLVIGANVIFADKRKIKEKEEFSGKIDEKIEKFKEREAEFENKKSDFEKIKGEIEEKEKTFQSTLNSLMKKEKEFNEKLFEEESVMKDKLRDVQKNLEVLRKKEDSMNNKLKTEEFRLASLEEDLLREKDDILKLKTGLESEKNEFLDKSENLNRIERELKHKEIDIEETKKELIKLDNEIKEWEGTHWRLRRDKKPPSAI